MSTFFEIAVSVALLALIAALVSILVRGWRQVMSDDGPLPLFGMIARRGPVPAN